MLKQANILDWPQKGLNPQIWNEDNTLKPDVKKFILDFISSFAQANNFKDTFVWLTQVKFVGSLTTNLWNSHSDVDIHCEVDLPKFVEIEHLEMTEKEASDYLDGIRKQVDQVKAKVPETEHPLEIYFETEFTTRASQQFSGTYSVLENKWLSEPHIVGEDFDISTLHPDLLNLAKETAAELDESFGEIKQDVQDIKELAETIGNWPVGQRELLEKKLQKRLDELENEIKDLVTVREDVAKKRKHYDAISEQEVRFKYLQKYYYMHVLTDLKTLLKQSPELSTKDIPVVENIMQQASLKEAAYADMDSQERCDQVIMVDFDDTIAHENQDQTLDQPLEGAKEVLQDLKNQGYYIVIDSARANEWDGEDEIKEYLDKYQIPYDEIFQGNKPLAFRYIDDRAIQMTTWQDVLKKVEEAKQSDEKIDKECSLSQKYWIDPSGKEYPLKDKEGHLGFVRRVFKTPQYHEEQKTEDMLIEGWTRITNETSHNSDFAIEVADLKRLSPYLDNFIAQHYTGNGIEIDDLEGNYVVVSDPFPSIQKQVNKNLRQPRMAASLSKKDAAFNPYEDETLKQGPAYAVYIGTQETGLSDFPPIKLYNIFGDHPQFGSTVAEETLKELGIPIREQKIAQLGSEYDYSSTQFNLPKELSEKIIRWAVENIPEEKIVHDSIDPGTKGIQLESHITLKYGLLTNNFEEVQKALEGEKSPHIKFGKTSFFEPEGKDYDVVIITVESEDLQNLNKKLCEAVKHEDTQGSEYHPHVTVAYVKRGSGKEWEGKDIITGEEIDLPVLMFSPKEGEKRELELGKPTEKESSFMPSNTDLAPSDDWAGTVGYPMNESMDAPQNKSDEETWYSPENDRPRTKTFWQKMLSLFQKPLSKKEPKNIVPVKEASSNVFMLETDSGLQTKALKDPTPEQARNLFNACRGEIKQLRWASDVNGHLYMWDAWSLTHWDAMRQIPAPWRQDFNTGISYSADQAADWARRFQKEALQRAESREYYRKKEMEEKQIPVTSKQWVTPTEHVNQPGMDWGWADYIYNYVDENWQDLLIGWLELDPKNYVKPVVLIEKIYEDEGGVSAWVHIEFVNTAGNADAFMKLVISADIHYEPSVEPEGVETHEYLDHWETEVLDYGVKDELEKAGGYGPTNYKGPSVADELYQDSPYRMNVTYSPEEDEELMDQNGKGGYPNRWMSRHRGPYYTNEGKVVKMLEETSAALSKKDIEKRAIGNISGWLAPDGKFYPLGKTSHDGWIFANWNILTKRYGIVKPNTDWEDPNVGWLILKGWTRVDGNLPNELDLEVENIKNIPQSAEQFVWKYKPEVVIVEDSYGNDTSFDKEEYSKGLMKKAALSGQTVNTILKLIEQNGGATYNLSNNKNLVGTDAYAVAIYPDREQIVNLVDYNNLEGYLVENEDLLSNPNNSFGAWVSGGKTYLDVVATVKDKREAMYLGYQHNQLAIFDLKNLVEIPLQRVASLKQASSIVEVPPFGYKVFVNPTKQQTLNLLSRSEHHVIRGLIDARTGDLYVWDAFHMEHSGVMRYLGVEVDSDEESIWNVSEKNQVDWMYSTADKIKARNRRKAASLKEAGAVSDREQQKYYDEIYSDRWRDDSSPIDGGNEYNKGWSELNGNDYPSAKDLDKERGLLDQIEKPINRNMPTGLGEYAITYYDAFPDQGDQGGI
jgi:2'-5' RNA ligase